jgi:hypothetical protein
LRGEPDFALLRALIKGSGVAAEQDPLRVIRERPKA